MANIVYSWDSVKATTHNGNNITQVNFNGSSLWSKGSSNTGNLSDSHSNHYSQHFTPSWTVSNMKGTAFGLLSVNIWGSMNWWQVSGPSQGVSPHAHSILKLWDGATLITASDDIDMVSGSGSSGSYSWNITNTYIIPPGMQVTKVDLEHWHTSLPSSGNGTSQGSSTIYVRVYE